MDEYAFEFSHPNVIDVYARCSDVECNADHKAKAIVPDHMVIQGGSHGDSAEPLVLMEVFVQDEWYLFAFPIDIAMKVGAGVVTVAANEGGKCEEGSVIVYRAKKGWRSRVMDMMLRQWRINGSRAE